MFLAEPAATEFDLRFVAFRIPVRVHPFFWLLTAMFGFQGGGNAQSVILWVGCVFVSILVHEMGHALTAQAFGGWPHVVLYGMGGLAINTGERTHPQRLLVLLMGPGAGFLLYGLIRLAAPAVLFRFPQYQLLLISSHLMYINLWWGILNLMPVWPLDGGQICGTLMEMARVRQAARTTQAVSMVTGFLLAGYFLTQRSYFPTFLFGYLAVASLQYLMNHRSGYSDGDYGDRRR